MTNQHQQTDPPPIIGRFGRLFGRGLALILCALALAVLLWPLFGDSHYRFTENMPPQPQISASTQANATPNDHPDEALPPIKAD